MSGSLGWLTESTILPKKAREIEDVGKASMVDLHAALYATEAIRSSQDPTVRAAEERKRKEARSSGPADILARGGAASSNRGVSARAAADERAVADQEG